MAKEKSNKEKALIEKEVALEAIKSLIHDTNASLNTKYLKSHDKVGILYQDHIIEIYGGEETFLKYMSIKIPISPKEHKEILSLFMSEVKRRSEDIAVKKLKELRKLMESR